MPSVLLESVAPRSIDEAEQIMRPLIKQFTSLIKYDGIDSSCDDDVDRLVQGMHEEAAIIGIPYPEGSHSWYCFKAALYYVRFCFPRHSLDARIYTGIFTWISIMVDDGANEDPEEWQYFIHRFHAGLKHHSPLAQAWADILRLAFKFYSPTVANFIITSSLNFTNANVLEGSEVLKMTPTAGGEGWSWYLRDKNGIAEAFTLLTFPKDRYPDMSNFMEAIADMNKYLCFTNDILSFYKEEKAGEKDNYIHVRAAYAGKDVLSTLQDVIEEDVNCVRRIQLVVRGREPYAQALHDHIMGFVRFHTTAERYRLAEVGLGEKCRDLMPRQKKNP
ncbi:isoprenoid synthase domain-containing protein [Biscogniauxia mediterranea]|nr:isoprenoid synthase domain-containing protein [Biscogniauxia mediterranea]